MNYYQHHIGDFIRDTSRLSDSQCMAYMRMLWIYYETEQPLENDADAVAFKIGANASDVHQILKHFFFLHDGLWHQSRCDAEILAFQAKSDKAKKSADARWKSANAMRTHSDSTANEPVSDANQKPVTSNQSKPKAVAKKPPPRAHQLPTDFYPNETGVEYADTRRVCFAVELESFRNWHNAKGTTMKDWQSAWRTWCDKSVEFGRAGQSKGQAPPRMSHADQSKLAAARTIWGTEIEGSHGTENGRIIDITPPARQVDQQDISGVAGQLRLAVP